MTAKTGSGGSLTNGLRGDTWRLVWIFVKHLRVTFYEYDKTPIFFCGLLISFSSGLSRPWLSRQNCTWKQRENLIKAVWVHAPCDTGCSDRQRWGWRRQIPGSGGGRRAASSPPAGTPSTAGRTPPRSSAHTSRNQLRYFRGKNTIYCLHGVIAEIRSRGNLNSEAKDEVMNSLWPNIMVVQCLSKKTTCCLDIS